MAKRSVGRLKLLLMKLISQVVQDETALRLDISLGLRNAIENNEFYINLQPIFGSDSGVTGRLILLDGA